MKYPAYPCDASGDILEPACFDFIEIWPEHEFDYIWDMNGTAMCAEDISHTVEAIELDKKLSDWCKRYRCIICGKTWDSVEAQDQFDKDGLDLAKAAFTLFGGKKTIIYRSTRKINTVYPVSNETTEQGAAANP